MGLHPDFFISYSTQDLKFVSKLHTDLEKTGLSMWRDKTHIRADDNWPEAIHQALHKCRFMILVLSKNSMASVQVKREWFFFLDKSKPLLCIWLEDCDVHFQLSMQQRTDFRSDDTYENSLKLLIKECQYLVKNSNIVALTTGEYRSVSMTKLTWDTVATKVAYFTEHMLGVRYREKYSADYYLQRPSILEHFKNFLDSNRQIMVLTGRAGTGKSSFICSLNNELSTENLILLQDCAHLTLDNETSIDDYLCSILGIDHQAIQHITELYDNDPSRRLILLFDAVNEFSDRKLLLQKLSDLIISIKTPAIKVLVTSRIPVWNGIKRYLTVPIDQEFHTAGPNSYVNVDTFSDKELFLVYNLYREQYKLQTQFHELPQQTKNLFYQPLFLKLTAEAFKGEKIPGQLVLQDVFQSYVKQCLGSKGFESPEFAILKRTIELMYVHARRELEVSVLRQDPEINLADFSNYKSLVDYGLLSERNMNESLLRKTEMVFVTYERVFEFLLADIAVHNITAVSLLQHLTLAREQSFIQLRGALELLLGFVIMNTKSYDLVLEIARLEHPDGRQFLIDVIRTVYDSGYHDLAREITQRLSQDHSQFSKLLAVQTAYNLKLDDLLKDLALSNDEILKDTSAIFLYQRWNKARLDGNIDDGYKILYNIVDSIKLRNPVRSKKAISALLSITANLLSHLVDDPESLIPLADIFQKLVRKVPGLEPKPDRNSFIRFTSDKGIEFISSAFAYTLNKSFQETTLNDHSSMASFFSDPKNGRALMDSGPFWNVDNLLEQKERLKRLFTWKHDLPAIQIRGPVLYHLYKTPDLHMDFIEDLFYEVLETGHTEGTIHLAAAMIYSQVCRVLRNEAISDEHISQIEEITLALWDFLDDIGKGVEIRNTTIGLFIIEAVLQKKSGLIKGSAFLKKILNEIGISIKPANIEDLFGSLERFAYLGYPEFCISTILDEEIRSIWEINSPQTIIKLLANIRSFYQEETDSLLLENDTERNRKLWNNVRSFNTMPKMEDIFTPSFNLWLVATSVVPMITKLGGVVILDLATSNSMGEFIDRILKTLLSALFNYNNIDIGTIWWFRCHDQSWDNFENWEIPRECNNPKFHPEIHKHAQERVNSFIQAVGRGIYYDEL